MKVYGYTYTETNYSASYSSKANRDVVVRGAPNVHLWEYDIPDDIVEPPGENTPPITFGSVIKAKVALDSRTGPATIILARIGDSEFPWVGIDPRHDSTNAWKSSVIQSWEPLHTIPSADVLSQFIFQTQGHLMEAEEADSLVAFIEEEMTK